MSVLLIGWEGEEAIAAIRRLHSQDDQVQMVEPDRFAAQAWRDLGAFVAVGDPTDPDLVERSAYETRTLALFDRGRPGVATAIVEGVRVSGALRLVLFTGDPNGESATAFSSSGMPYVIVALPKKTLLGRARIEPARLAEVLDAADDLAGEPKLTADLSSDEGWEALGLSP
ncbi:MAG: hypothetical protein JJE05_10340 [Actinobacteria bacterium]|nr:hypothetical protein [Actinomycetota bacterium]